MLKYNKLCLGTAQLGMQYGIKNVLQRQPTLKESFAILEAAVQSGIDTFDTASAYGNAEEILGEFGVEKLRIKVISKLQFTNEEREKEDFEKLIGMKISTSLEKLKLMRIYGYLLHTPTDLYNEKILEELLKYKRQGLIKKIGVSIYEVEDALLAVQNPMIDIVQIPYNILDRRLEKIEFFTLAQKHSVKIFARSAFLQGLLLMHAEQIPSYLTDAVKYVEYFECILKKYNFQKKEAALLFCYCHPQIEYVVFGVETLKQLEENLLLLNRMKEFQECYEKLYKAFEDFEIPRAVLLPNLWRRV